MPTITKQSAVRRIDSQIDDLGPDDLVEVYNEVFPDAPVSMDQNLDGDRLFANVKRRIGKGLEVEEIIDLWNVLFPKDKNVWYDEEAGIIRYNEEPERIESPD